MQGLEGEIVEYEFQQDNASVHTSKLTMTYFDNSDINLIKWPRQTLIPLNIYGLILNLNEELDNILCVRELEKHCKKKCGRLCLKLILI